MSNSGRFSLRDHHFHHNYPSFSSSLLEEIYRSFDEEREHRCCSDNYSTPKITKMKKSCSTNSSRCGNGSYLETEKSRANYFDVDQWMESRKLINLRRQSMAVESDKNLLRPISSFSPTSSSDSSSGIGGFSSSDTDSLYGGSSKPKPKPKTPALKPILTSISGMNQPEIHRKIYSDDNPGNMKKNNKKEGILHRRALKLYGDLKKVKQPISPGGKLSSFLNSLFNSSISKKPKISPSPSSSNGLKLERESTSMPSTAKSFSRSCLSKTRLETRSVRFYPVSLIVDEDCRPCGQKPVYNSEQRENGRHGDVARFDWSTLASDDELKSQIMEKHRRVQEIANQLLKKYHHREELTVNNINSNNNGSFDDNGDDDDSCCSSDLFELENFTEIGADRYREELPVYETTHVDTNRAIASGYIL